MGQDFETVGDAGSEPTEVGRRVHQVDCGVLECRDLVLSLIGCEDTGLCIDSF